MGGKDKGISRHRPAGVHSGKTKGATLSQERSKVKLTAVVFLWLPHMCCSRHIPT
ncbi:hypothetical protein ACRRTK_019782 [Alexandromys fortis]